MFSKTPKLGPTSILLILALVLTAGVLLVSAGRGADTATADIEQAGAAAQQAEQPAPPGTQPQPATSTAPSTPPVSAEPNPTVAQPVTQDDLSAAAEIAAAYVTAMYSHVPGSSRAQAEAAAKQWASAGYLQQAIADQTRMYPSDEEDPGPQFSAHASAMNPTVMLSTPSSATIRFDVSQQWSQEGGTSGESTYTAQVTLIREEQQWRVMAVTDGSGDAGDTP